MINPTLVSEKRNSLAILEIQIKINGAGEGNRTLVRSMGSSYSAIELRPHGGEGGIRTPDTREGMHDFESCAFNQALPPLR